MKDKQVFLAGLILLYLAVTYFGVQSIQYDSDEFFYYMMGKEIIQGNTPYIDFFSAHMPLMIYPIALSFKILGATVYAGKLVPIIFSFILIYLVYLIGEETREGVGWISAGLVFLSPFFQIYNHNMYGLMISGAVVAAAVYAYVKERHGVSGFLCMVCLFTRLNTIYIVLGLLYFNRRKKQFYQGLLMGTPFLLLFLVPGFIEDTILYHLHKASHPIGFRLGEIASFVKTNWLILGACVMAAPTLYNKQDKGFNMLVLGSLYTVFTLTQSNVYEFYLFLGLPFLALAAGSWIGSLKKEKKNTVVIIICVWVLAGIPQTIDAYSSTSKVEDFKGYLLENTRQGDNVTCLMVGCRYLVFSTNRNMDPGLIDVSDDRIQIHDKEFTRVFKRSIEKENSLVLLDLKELSIYSQKMGVDFTEGLNHLYENYFPVKNYYSIHNYGESQNWWNEVNQAVFFKPRREIPAGETIPAPKGFEDKYYLEQYTLMLGNLSMSRKNQVSRIVDQPNKKPYIPGYLLGNNSLGLQVVNKEFLQWPVTVGTHQEIAGEVEAQVWTLPGGNDSINIISLHHRGQDILSLTQATYDIQKKEFTGLRVFSKLSEKKLTGYLPTYIQQRITRNRYRYIVESSNS